MADYEDDVEEIAPFFAYFPVYREMNVNQLRSYFTFRKYIRKGKFLEVSLSYIFVYVYEILMQVGVGSPEEGLDILEEITDKYAKSEPKLKLYLLPWIRDYIAYYGLSDRKADYFARENDEDARALLLAHYETADDPLLFETVKQLSSYKIENGALYKLCPDELTSVAGRVIRSVIPIYEQRSNQKIDELYFGKRIQFPHTMFASAVFYSPNLVKEKIFDISPRRQYICKAGLWTVDSYGGRVFSSKSEEIFGKILHETDRRLRLGLKKGIKISHKLRDMEIETLIQREIDSYLKDKEEAARPKIEVDFSQLDRIRTDAALIRNALLSEEEKSVDASSTQTKAVIGSETDLNKTVGVPSTRISNEQVTTAAPDQKERTIETNQNLAPTSGNDEQSLFSSEEQQFLHLLLDGGDWKSYLRTISVPIGVISERINEKMMDELQDIVLTDIGNGPEVIEDYREDILNRI